MSRKRRQWEVFSEEDPLAGLVNLFDLWMVFSIALLLALVGHLQERDAGTSSAAAADNSSAPTNLDEILESRRKLPQFRVSHEQLTGSGERLGTAYRLQSGDVVYVPD